MNSCTLDLDGTKVERVGRIDENVLTATGRDACPKHARVAALDDELANLLNEEGNLVDDMAV